MSSAVRKFVLLNNFSQRERYLALGTMSLIAIAVVYAFLIIPLYAGWTGLNNRVRSKIGALEKGYRILASQKMLESEYSKLSKYAKSGGSEETAVADTLAYIENISRNDSCFVANIKPIGITNEPSYKEILIDVTVEAPIAQFSKFIYDIENPRDVLVNIKRFTLSAKSGQAGNLKGTFLVSKILLE